MSAEKRKSTRWRAPEEPCLNCGDPTPGRYCPSCGQRKTEVRVSVRTMFAEVLEDQLALNRALPRTVVALLFRPGRLTNEYIRGRIVSYIPPFRLYLVASVLFFLIFSFLGLGALDLTTTESGVVGAADSAQAAAVRQQVLEELDTVAMPAAARAAVRESIAEMNAAAAARDTAAPPDTASTDAAADAPEAPVRGGLQPWARDFNNQTTVPIMREAIDRKVAELGHLPPREAANALLEDFTEYAPHMVFLLLPVFAFLLKLLYIRRNRYYAEHFVFALHVHAFTFVTFTLMFLIPWDWLDGVLFLWMVIYVWLAMRAVYRQGFFRTTVKWWVLGWSYMFVLTFGIIGLGIATLLLT